MQNAEPVERFNEFVCMGRDVDPEIVTAKVHLERRESALQRRSSLRQADPWRRPCAVHPDRLGEIDDPGLFLMDQDEPWVIDFSEAIRVDRAGSSPWIRLTEARAALESGLAALQVYFRRYDLQIDVAAYASELVESLDRFGVLQ